MKIIVVTITLLFCTLFTAQNTDINTLRKVNLNRNKNLDSFFIGITNSDTPVSFGVPILVYSLGILQKDTAHKYNGITIVSSLFITGIITTSLKYSIRRDRPFITYPDIEKLAGGGSPSFPSGHTSTAFSTATALSLSYPKWYIIAPSYLWASAVGYSRMHLGVHYPSDVFVGALIGAGSAWLSAFLTKKYRA